MTNEKPDLSLVVEEGERLYENWARNSDRLSTRDGKDLLLSVLSDIDAVELFDFVSYLHNNAEALLAAAKEAEGLREEVEIRERHRQEDKCPDCYNGSVITAAPADGEGSYDEEVCSSCCGSNSKTVAAEIENLTQCLTAPLRERLDTQEKTIKDVDAQIASLRQSLADAEKERDAAKEKVKELTLIIDSNRWPDTAVKFSREAVRRMRIAEAALLSSRAAAIKEKRAAVSDAVWDARGSVVSVIHDWKNVSQTDFNYKYGTADLETAILSLMPVDAPTVTTASQSSPEAANATGSEGGGQGEARTSVITHCNDCGSHGVNKPGETDCGDCGSSNTYKTDAEQEREMERIYEKARRTQRFG